MTKVVNLQEVKNTEIDQNNRSTQELANDLMIRLREEHGTAISSTTTITPSSTSTIVTVPSSTPTTITVTNTSSAPLSQVNHNESDNCSVPIPKTETNSNLSETARAKYNYLEMKKKFAKDQLCFRTCPQNNNNINTQEVIDTTVRSTPSEQVTTTVSNEGEHLRNLAEQANIYAEGMNAVAAEQLQLVNQMNAINQRIANLYQASRRLGLEYVQFMWTNPIAGVLSTGAVVAVVAISMYVVRSGLLGNMRRAITSSFTNIDHNNALIRTTTATEVVHNSNIENVIRQLAREGWNRISIFTQTGGGIYFLRWMFRGIRRR